MSSFCGIDVGTQGVRAVIVGRDGGVLGSGQRGLPEGLRSAGRHEQDPDDWWEALVGAVRDATREAGDEPVTALALDATSGTVLVEDPDGRPRGPALMYDDSRASEEVERVERLGAELWSSLGYRMQATWALPKVLWLLDHADLRPGDRVVHQADHLLRRLSGTPVPTDTSHALKTGADLRTATWPAGLFSDLGVPAGLLPELVLPGTTVGSVSSEAAEATGLTPGVLIRAGMTDGCASQIAAGALEIGSWSSTLGTTLVIKGATRDQVVDPTGAVYSHRHPDGGWLPGGASSSGTAPFATLLPDRDLDALTSTAATQALAPATIYPLAGRGERFPFVAAEAESFVTGAAGRTPADLDDVTTFTAVCRGIAYVERLAYDCLGLLGADVTGPVAMTGGGARNDWLNQLRCDVLGRPTVVPTSSGAAAGMAVFAAAEPGHLAETARRMVRSRASFEPDPDRGEALAPGYRGLVGELVDRGWLDPAVSRGVLETEGAR